MASPTFRKPLLLMLGASSLVILTAATIPAITSDPAFEDANQPQQSTDAASLPPAPDRPAPLRYTQSGDGFLIIKPPKSEQSDTTSKRVSGTVVRYTVEIESGLKTRARELSEIADQVLQDRKRGWGSDGSRNFQRVTDVNLANVRVVLANPATVDSRCAAIGLFTAGTFSCWDGSRAMINLERWKNGATDFKSLDNYRRYVINHEVGHGLGFGHQSCPSAGALAPLMMQQTKTTGACRPNAWPYP